VPIFLVSKEQEAVAVVHAGWCGLKSGVIANTISVLTDKFKVRSSELHAAVGPHIQKCCYEVGSELREVFGIADGRSSLDLARVAKDQLGKEGIIKISSSGLCTCCSGRYFSYRKEKTANRIMSLIKIQEPGVPWKSMF